MAKSNQVTVEKQLLFIDVTPFLVFSVVFVCVC